MYAESPSHQAFFGRERAKGRKRSPSSPGLKSRIGIGGGNSRQRQLRLERSCVAARTTLLCALLLTRMKGGIFRGMLGKIDLRLAAPGLCAGQRDCRHRVFAAPGWEARSDCYGEYSCQTLTSKFSTRSGSFCATQENKGGVSIHLRPQERERKARKREQREKRERGETRTL